MTSVVGLDIGTTKVCTIIAEVQPDRTLNVVGYGRSDCTGLQRGTVVDIEQTVRAIESAVEDAQSRSGRILESAFVGVTGDHIESLNRYGEIMIANANHEITNEDLQRVREQAGRISLPPDREVLHLIEREYVIDGQKGVRAPVGMYGTRLAVDAHLVTAGTTFLQNIRRCVERAGLHIEELVLEPLAASYAVLSSEECEAGTALVDIGGGTSDVAIFYEGGICFSGVVPLGGKHVTRDVSLLFKITPDEAERLKKESGCALEELVSEAELVSYTEMGTQILRTIPRRLLAGVIQARMEETLEMVADELKRSDRHDLLAAGVVLTGGGANLPGASELAKRVFHNLPVRIGRPYSHLSGLIEDLRDPAYATAVGLALYGARRLGTPAQGQTNPWQKFQHLVAKVFPRRNG